MELEGESDATASVQAMERLHLTARSFSDTERNLMLKEKIRSALDQLREVKALVEGSHDTFVPLSINEQPLLELKQLLLMHVPSSITDEARQRFFMLIDQALADRCKKIVAGVVLTCPWYAATQKERGEQAKHNMLLVVVMNDDRQFFSPANLQTKEAGGVVDLGWLSVVELFHFGRFLVKGRTRYVETAFCDKDALVYSSDEWQHLRDQLSVNTVTGLRPFQEACCGQAMGSVAKKRQNGGMKLKESATLAEICEAFRLLNHAHNHHDNRPPVTNGLHPSSLPETALQALEKLKALYKDPDVSKQDIFACLCSWHDALRGRMKQTKFSDQKAVVAVVGEWMMATRLQGRTLDPVKGVADGHSRLLQLMLEIGGPLTKLTPDQVLLVARAGSYMYGLSTPDSDTDYVVVYRDTSQSVLSASSRPSECFESRGPEKQLEYGAYEARLLCEMLLKGSVVILELVYQGDHEYVSPLWQQLYDNKEKFVTELGIQQYLGLIKNNFTMIHSHKLKDTGRERKLFYQIFHKMACTRHMLAGEAPPVRVTGPVRDFIMDVRTKKLEGELSRESLLSKATSEYDTLRHQLANRLFRLPENPDYEFVTNWLLAVRGSCFG
ncbi:uncharacterized protein [Littorina saxatilis]|uniref:Uncharacterized protein n=1 Tax=Littorina saxatilis TaxID=31220 RepID=A0AAN9B0X2_9CAEN